MPNQTMESYWLQELEEPLPKLELPYDKLPEKIRSEKGSAVATNVGSERMERVEAYMLQQHTDKQTLLLSCQFALLHKLTGDRDIIIGIESEIDPHSNESLPNRFGLPIRISLHEGISFSALLRQVEEKCSLGLRNSRFLYEELASKFDLKQSGLENALYATMFRYIDASFSRHTAGDASLPLVLQCRMDDYDAELQLLYDPSLFRAVTIEAYMRYYLHIVDQVLDEPQLELASIALLTEQEIEESLLATSVLQARNDTDRLMAHEQFERQASLTPEAPALIFEQKTMTYQELNARANRLARTLRTGGVTPDGIVVIIAHRSPDLLIGILAVLKAGAAYLAIDPTFPEDRKQFMLGDSGCRFLLVQRELKGDIDAEKIWHLDEESNYDEDDRDLEPVSGMDNLAYIIYTSGSTGRPKGIMIEHRGLVHFFAGFAAELPLLKGQRILGLATVSFDIFIVETLLPLSLGMTIVLASEEEKNDPSRLSVLLTKEQVDVLQLTPSRYKWWSAQSGATEAFSRLTLLMIGAEPLTPSIWRSLKACLSPSARLFNLYGPTETTVWASAQEVTEEQHPITIGRGLTGTPLLVMNADGQLQPDGVPGELYIGGPGLGRGYMNRPDLTEAAFVRHRYRKGEKLYRTGDIVRKLQNGDFLYIGRRDFQVKIRGFRIEMGEIEQVLLRYPGIHEAVLHTVPIAGQDELALCAYIVAEEQPDAAKLRQYLASQLPAYLIPSYTMSLEAIPLTPTGKVDRKSLPDPTKHSTGILQDFTAGGEHDNEPHNEQEGILFAVWEKLLGHRAFHRNQPFFDSGGSSIMIIRVCSQLEQEGWKLKVEDMFRHQTIASIAPLMKRTASEHQEWSLFSGTIEGKVEFIRGQQAYLAKACSSSSGRVYDYSIVYCPEGFDERMLTLALGRVMERHDALRIGYFPKGDEVIQYNQGMFAPLFKFEQSELPKDQPIISYMEQMMEEADRRRSRFSDWRLEAHWCKGDAGDYLALMGDPLVMDAFSWNILLEDLGSAYQQAVASTDIRLPAKTNSFQLYAQLMKEQEAKRGGQPQIDRMNQTTMHRYTVSLGANMSELLLSSISDENDEWFVENILAHTLLQAIAEEWRDEQAHIRLDARTINLPGLNYSRTIGRMDQTLTVALNQYAFEPDRPVQEFGIADDTQSVEDGIIASPTRLLVRMDKLAASMSGLEMICHYRQPTGFYEIEGSFGKFESELYVAFDYANSEDSATIRLLADRVLGLVQDVASWYK
ncbi:non-ribosomal peptide synthetase [Paenibacillus sp. 1011MAR3C5]|uniref:non-ribosomal peptide synthetase n=1 Tax=Paenibacillus sp. 1011MAR3C5 TaxID=1675787 RepID=UPI000E6C1DC1|nr:amino acid adenylation domain-containing protein [Paenibacillus sp. 1011MAR3C5]RJE90947.1 non-ribosomal peptide synthetase [Paenibacillus sp. 1011MAR3C5]